MTIKTLLFTDLFYWLLHWQARENINRSRDKGETARNDWAIAGQYQAQECTKYKARENLQKNMQLVHSATAREKDSQSMPDWSLLIGWKTKIKQSYITEFLKQFSHFHREIRRFLLFAFETDLGNKSGLGQKT